ncbi:MAG: hypothetical protein GY820_25200, partial [Gammaproteobacteria bacterium]|nr:hypothetical protein [Gammaproteobacteria bacterium]
FLNGSSGTVSNSELRNNTNGITFSGNSNGTVSNSELRNNTYGLYFPRDSTASPVIIGSLLTGNTRGIYMYLNNAAPTITDSTITANSYGVYLANSAYGSQAMNPNPVITGSGIYANTSYNYYTDIYINAVNTVLAATGNWWGSADPAVIASGIRDYTDNTSAPVVDFSGYLDGPGGTSAGTDAGLSGALGDATTLVPGQTYLVLNNLSVPVGQTLTIPSGVRLVFQKTSHGLTVDGTVIIAGTRESPVVLTSTSQYPAAGDWSGIQVNSGGNLSIGNAQILYAKTAVDATAPGQFDVSDSVIQQYSIAGVALSQLNGGTISTNLIESTGYSATGIRIETASPLIEDNRVHGNLYGVYVAGASLPLLTGNLVTDNQHGIYLAGSGNDATSPNPVISGNDIYGNLGSQLTVDGYGLSSAITIDVTGNWWGTETPIEGVDIILNNSPSGLVNASAALTAGVNTALSMALMASELYFSPNADSQQDSTVFTATLNTPESWVLGIYDRAGLVNTFSGSGATVSVSWNGDDSSTMTLGDGFYTARLYAGDVINGSLMASTTVLIDNTYPVASLDSPSAGIAIKSGEVLDVLGTAIDIYYTQHSVEYRREGESVWTPVTNTTVGSVANASLGQWLIGSLDGSVTPPTDGNYDLRLTVADLAGNRTQLEVPFSLALVGITNVSRQVLNSTSGDGINQTAFSPVEGEIMQINFTLSVGATVDLHITPELGGEILRSISQTYAGAGSYSLAWDGKDDQGSYVDDEAYEYTLVASTPGGSTATYDPGATTSPSFNFVRDLQIDPASNDYYKAVYTLSAPGRVYLGFSYSQGTYYLANGTPLPAGSGTLIGDMRSASGEILYDSFRRNVTTASSLPVNAVILEGTQPKLSGAAPYIEIKSDPYRVFHSYDQVSQISYQLDQDAFITFKMLPPGVYDETSASVVTLIDNVLTSSVDGGGEPLVHGVQWSGYETGDPGRILVSSEGVGSFWIRATSAVTGKSTEYRGSLQMYQ